MEDIKNIFFKSIDNINNILALYDYLERNHFNAVDFSDILRWVWVQSLSVLDKFLHDIILKGMVIQFLDYGDMTEKLKNFKFTANQAKNLSSITDLLEREKIVRQIFSERNNCETYQDPEKICDALSYIWNENHKLKKISSKMGMTDKYVKEKLKIIVSRRNQIAHQNDIQSHNFDKTPINKDNTKDVLVFIRNLGEAIYECINET